MSSTQAVRYVLRIYPSKTTVPISRVYKASVQRARQRRRFFRRLRRRVKTLFVGTRELLAPTGKQVASEVHSGRTFRSFVKRARFWGDMTYCLQLCKERPHWRNPCPGWEKYLTSSACPRSPLRSSTRTREREAAANVKAAIALAALHGGNN